MVTTPPKMVDPTHDLGVTCGQRHQITHKAHVDEGGPRADRQCVHVHGHPEDIPHKLKWFSVISDIAAVLVPFSYLADPMCFGSRTIDATRPPRACTAKASNTTITGLPLKDIHYRVYHWLCAHDSHCLIPQPGTRPMGHA
jgi:hypothetical protein